MPRKRPVGDDDLYAIAVYLSRPEAKTEIHAELPERHRAGFEKEYDKATAGGPLPKPSRSAKDPYFIWPDSANKQGRELRIYFMSDAPEPPIIRSLTDRGKRWPVRPNQRRINHSNLVMQLCECGFVLGANTDRDRIEQFMRKRFPVR